MVYAPPEGSRLPWEDCLTWEGRPFPSDGLPDMVSDKVYLVLSSGKKSSRPLISAVCCGSFLVESRSGA